MMAGEREEHIIEGRVMRNKGKRKKERQKEERVIRKKQREKQREKKELKERKVERQEGYLGSNLLIKQSQLQGVLSSVLPPVGMKSVRLVRALIQYFISLYSHTTLLTKCR